MSVDALHAEGEDSQLLADITSRLTRIGDRLGLTPTWRWQVWLEDLNQGREPGEKGATVEWPRNYRKATFKFDRYFLTNAPDDLIEHCALHEWLHLLFAGLEDSLQEDIGDKSYVWFRYNEHREQLVDALTTFILRPPS